MPDASRRRALAVGTLLIAAIPSVVSATSITVTKGNDSFTFTNLDTRKAIDFDVTLVTQSGPGIDIDISSGGPPFPHSLFGGPKVDGGWGSMTYKGGPGIPPGGTYSHSFPGWPDGTMFEVIFTYPPPQNPNVIRLDFQGHYPTDGETAPVPEPGVALLFLAGCAGLAAWKCR